MTLFCEYLVVINPINFSNINKQISGKRAYNIQNYIKHYTKSYIIRIGET